MLRNRKRYSIFPFSTLRTPLFLLCAFYLLNIPSAIVPQLTPFLYAAPNQAEDGKKEAVQNLADLVPKIAILRESSESDSKTLSSIDTKSPEEALSGREEKSKELSLKLEELKKSRSYGYDQIADLKAEVRLEAGKLDKIRAGISESLEKLYGIQDAWSKEKGTLDAWKSSLSRSVKKATLSPTFLEANRIIDNMLAQVDARLKPILEVKKRLEEAESRINPILLELDDLLKVVREDIFHKSSPSMLSPDYYGQFHRGMLSEAVKQIVAIQFPDRNFIRAEGWIILLQFLIALLLIVGSNRYKNLISEEANLEFLIHRNVSASLFIATSSLLPVYTQAPPLWRLFLWGVICVTATQVVGCLISYYWKRRLIALLAFLFFAIQFFRVFGLPEPLFRIYVALVALGGFPLCLWRARVSEQRNDRVLYSWSLRFGAVILLVVLVAQLTGYSALAAHLLGSTIKTIFLVLLSWIFILMIRGMVDFLLTNTYLYRITVVRQNKSAISRRIRRLTDLAVVLNTTLLILVAWRFFESPSEAFHSLISYGFSVGEQKFMVKHLLLAGAVLYAAILISSILQSILLSTVFPRKNVEKGAGISIVRLFHYAFLFLGFLFALSVLGFDLKSLVILTGALGVGIGFGLQNIANNLISGIILLFERPIKVGDVVQIDGEWGEIEKIGLRATVVRTIFRSEIIVPNNDLISNQVVNWTLSDRMVRLRIPVGVAYGSDVSQVMQTLSQIAVDHPVIIVDPEPRVLFVGFGDSSLDFELHGWITDVRKIFDVKSELHQEIDRRFREQGIVIPFPQRDLHLKSGVEIPHPSPKRD